MAADLPAAASRTVKDGPALPSPDNDCIKMPRPKAPPPLGDELLPAVDVVGRAGEGRVDHDVDGERGDVGG